MPTRFPGGVLDTFDRILGSSTLAAAMRAFGRRAAAVDATVLLTGETGTGKGILARAIHDASPRARGPFVAVNCAGVPASLFESEFFGHARGAFTGAMHAHRGLLVQADRGTLFLDEIAELPLALQAKLLTALEEREYRPIGGEKTARFDARLIAATGVNLQTAVEDQRFRADLYHRLRVLQFHLPPLRQRCDDIPILCLHFLETLAPRYKRAIHSVSAAALAQLRAHSWPGNIRELAHTIEAAVIASDHGSLALDHFIPSQLQPTPSSTRYTPSGRYSFNGTAEAEQLVIRHALQQCRGNKTHAARLLGMSRNTLLSRLKRNGG